MKKLISSFLLILFLGGSSFTTLKNYKTTAQTNNESTIRRWDLYSFVVQDVNGNYVTLADIYINNIHADYVYSGFGTVRANIGDSYSIVDNTNNISASGTITTKLTFVTLH
ncbi:hypothetical protein [Chitinophaga sp. HK235]|uniref:hypothetical protein n=1 Tax=Chitinophaga sp. HK235 TaxID=2952571 RepID=UPI001BA6B0CF|nr:hypothetical protein [Chitinophaga sp. HK235]